MVTCSETLLTLASCRFTIRSPTPVAGTSTRYVRQRTIPYHAALVPPLWALGVTVFAMADFAYLDEECLRVIDWKTGDFDPGHEAQPLLSAYCLRESRPELRDYAVEPILSYLSSGDRRAVPLPADLEQYVVDTVLPGISAMRRYLRDPAENAPLDITEFPRRGSGLCQSCNFSPLCEGKRA